MSSVSQTSTERLAPGERNPAAERIPAAERREQILAAASHVFGERGYAGATTDQVAQAAGISQPYVVRMFGGKENLFVEVLERALDKLTSTFRAAIVESAAAGEDVQQRGARMGAAYADLIGDRGILLSLMQAFTMGNEPTIGKVARDGFLAIYTLLRDEGDLPAESVVGFLAHGMLFNTLIALRMPDEIEDSTIVDELVTCAFGSKLDTVLEAVARARA